MRRSALKRSLCTCRCLPQGLCRWRICFLITVLALIPVLIFSGCLRQRRVIVQGADSGKKFYRSTSPVELSRYIRTVLRISQQNTRSENEALKRLHEQRPELADLAQRAAENPDDRFSRQSLTAAYLEEGLYWKAFQLCQQLRAGEPNNPSVELALARIWDKWGDDSLARRHAELAVELAPNSAEASQQLGRIHLHRNEPKRAISAFLAALQKGGPDASLLSNLGYACMKADQWIQARFYLEKAVELDGSLVQARNNLGIVRARLGSPEGAVREFLAVNKSAGALNNLGAVLVAQGRWEEARDAFRRALALERDHPKAQTNLSHAESYLPYRTVVYVSAFDQDGTSERESTISKGQRSLVAKQHIRRFVENGTQIKTQRETPSQASAIFSLAHDDTLVSFDQETTRKLVAAVTIAAAQSELEAPGWDRHRDSSRLLYREKGLIEVEASADSRRRKASNSRLFLCCSGMSNPIQDDYDRRPVDFSSFKFGFNLAMRELFGVALKGVGDRFQESRRAAIIGTPEDDIRGSV